MMQKLAEDKKKQEVFSCEEEYSWEDSYQSEVKN